MFNKSALMLSAAAMIAGSAAYAEVVSAVTATDLNLRVGPGAGYESVAVMPVNSAVSVEGCLEAANWCQVKFGDKTGWAASDYLAIVNGDTAVALAAKPEGVTVTKVEYTAPDTGAAAVTGAGAGAAAGALIAGPIGAVVGGIIGAAGAGEAAKSIDPKVTAYVTEHPVDAVVLDGELVVGAGIPDTVTLVPVPDSEYSYLYINGTPTLISNADRRVVHIIR